MRSTLISVTAALILLSTAALAAEANNTGTAVLAPSGGDDTMNFVHACSEGSVELTAGVYNVRAIVCRAITGFNADAGFWYEGQQPTIKLVGIATGARGVLTCPPPGPCAYQGFEVDPPPGSAGIVIDSVHGAQLLDVSVIDDQGQQSGACVDLNVNNGGDNQNIVVRGGTYEHCGGWCFDFSTVSDKGMSTSSWYGVNVGNCGLGGIHISFGYGNQFIGNHIVGQFGLPGIKLDTGGDDIVVGNLFDENFSDIVLGDVYLSVSGNQSCRTQGGAMFDIEGGVQINAAANLSCGPNYLIGANGHVSGAFYDPSPSYADQHSQDALAGVIH